MFSWWNVVYLGGNDCLSLEIDIYKNLQQNYSWKHFIIWFCIFTLGCVTLQSLKYGGIHDGNFEYIEKKGKRKVQGVPQSQTAALPRHHNFITSRPILKNFHQTKWLAKHFTPRLTDYIAFPFKTAIKTAIDDNFSLVLLLFFRENKSWHFMWIVCQAYSYEISRLSGGILLSTPHNLSLTMCWADDKLLLQVGLMETNIFRQTGICWISHLVTDFPDSVGAWNLS